MDQQAKASPVGHAAAIDRVIAHKWEGGLRRGSRYSKTFGLRNAPCWVGKDFLIGFVAFLVVRIVSNAHFGGTRLMGILPPGFGTPILQRCAPPIR